MKLLIILEVAHTEVKVTKEGCRQRQPSSTANSFARILSAFTHKSELKRLHAIAKPYLETSKQQQMLWVYVNASPHPQDSSPVSGCYLTAQEPSALEGICMCHLSVYPILCKVC